MRFAITALAALAMAPFAAHADLITFDDIGATSSTFVDDGFQFAGGSVGNFSAYPIYRGSYSGANAAMSTSNTMTLTESGGGTFSVSDFFIEGSSWQGSNAAMIVTGYLGGQRVGTPDSFNTSTGGNVWHDILLNSGPVDTVTFTTTDGVGFMLDNVTVAGSPVPEPGTIALLGAGLLCVVAVGYRRGTTTAA